MTTSDYSEDRGREDFIFICPTNLQCVLAAGGVADLAALREWCEALPQKSYGSVFVEAESPVQIEAIATPPGVSVTWLVRSSTARPQGESLVEAVDGWLDEWLRADPLTGRSVSFWGEFSANECTERSFRRITDELTETWAAAAEYRDFHA